MSGTSPDQSQLVIGAPETVTEAPVPRYHLRFLGDPVLREVCQPVGEEVPRGLIPSMMNLVIRLRAEGIAAPQLGVPVQIIIFRQGGRPVVAINPRNVMAYGKKVNGEEGCLSIPKFFTIVKRSDTLNIEYETERRDIRITTLTGFEARTAQHELDHLQGKLITDGVPRQQRRRAERLVAAFLETNQQS